VRLEFHGHGWSRDLVGKMFDLAHVEMPRRKVAAMALLGTLMIETGGVIMVDTCPYKQTTARCCGRPGSRRRSRAPLELDTHEDELDALVVHASEVTAEELSRRLTTFGLRVASTSSADAAMELVAEMGVRCHAVVLAQLSDGELRAGCARTARGRESTVRDDTGIGRAGTAGGGVARPEPVT
jgi:hypothetical protein